MSDDFETSEEISLSEWSDWARGWHIVQEDGTSNHALLLETDYVEGGHIGDEYWRNYRLSFRFKFPTGGSPFLNVYLRNGPHTPPDWQNYHVTFGGDRFDLIKSIPADNVTLFNVPFLIEPKTWYQVDMLAESERIVVAVNYVICIDISDESNPYLFGLIEFGAIDNASVDWNNNRGGGTKILLDDVVVYRK